MFFFLERAEHLFILADLWKNIMPGNVINAQQIIFTHCNTFWIWPVTERKLNYVTTRKWLWRNLFRAFLERKMPKKLQKCIYFTRGIIRQVSVFFFINTVDLYAFLLSTQERKMRWICILGRIDLSHFMKITHFLILLVRF